MSAEDWLLFIFGYGLGIGGLIRVRQLWSGRSALVRWRVPALRALFSSAPTAMAGWWCGMLQLTTYRLAPHQAQPWLTYLLGGGFLLFGALSLSIYMFGRPQALVPPPLRGRDVWRNS